MNKCESDGSCRHIKLLYIMVSSIGDNSALNMFFMPMSLFDILRSL